MRNVILVLTGLVLLLAACSKKLTAEEQALADAKEVAEESYKALFAGQYDTFLSHRADGDSLPESYREQMIETYKQFCYLIEKEHGGINSLRVSNALRDTTLDMIQVFLILNFADSIQEEIVVPMVEESGKWKVK